MDTPLGSVLYITLGCAKNEVDTDRMRSLLTAAGYEEAFEPQDADIAIVNTCSFLASATSESIETTLELANEVQDGVRACPIVMCGCVPSRYGDDLPDELPEVAAFVKTDEEDGIVSVIDDVLGVEREIAAYIPQVKRTVEGAVAYVKISDGCNRFCSFCMIPYIRGRYHSRNAESIISEVRDLVAGGVREIVLIGQDTGIWGTDFADEDFAEGSPRNLAQLLRAVAEAVRPHNVWVRVLYLQPEGMTDELIETIRDTPGTALYRYPRTALRCAHPQGHASLRFAAGARGSVPRPSRAHPRYCDSLHGHGRLPDRDRRRVSRSYRLYGHRRL